MDLPAKFKEKMTGLLGREINDYLDSLQLPAVRGLRINTSKLSVREAIDRLPFDLTPVPWTDNGFIYDPESDRPSAHPYYNCGLYYLQEPSAMAPAAFLPVRKGDRILDLCAAPGGKTTQLAQAVQGAGLLVSNDISVSRSKALIKNIELFGLKNTVVTCERPDRLAGSFPDYFDAILVDAPCSGEGMFRQGPRMWRAWEEHGPEYFSPIQKGIVESAAGMLKPGGYMIYSTCTFDPREDEQVIAHLLCADPSIHTVSIPDTEGFENGHPEWTDEHCEEVRKTVRLYPHKIRGEGHFVALLQKDGPRTVNDSTNDVSVTVDREIGSGKKKRTLRMEVPVDITDVQGVRFLRSGLTIGELRHGQLIPSQAYAMTLQSAGDLPELSLSLSDDRVDRYLRGESLMVTPDDGISSDGYILIMIDGFPAGWGRVQGNRIKNDLLPGWRRQA